MSLKMLPLSSRRGKPPIHWLDWDQTGREASLSEIGLPKFRASQINRHLFVNHSLDASAWTDVPKTERQLVQDTLLPTVITQVRQQTCDRGATVKTLWRLFDGTFIESVLMRYPATSTSRARATLCISSQAGCGMGCPFCATGQGGLQRNLSAAEILAQVIASEAELRSGVRAGGAGRVSNVVFMGMGEPLANFKTVMHTVRALTNPSPNGLGISARSVTVSTVGVVPKIYKLADSGLPVTLAVSLHAPNDELRNELVPINTRFPLAEVIGAAHHYFEVTGRRVSIEYALMRDINDSVSHAAQLAGLLNSMGRGWVHVNLIPLNPTPGSKWTASRRVDQDAFVSRLEAARVPVTVRDTRGQEIDGACGQLAANFRRETESC